MQQRHDAIETPGRGRYQLIAAEVSLYSGKARAYLRHKGVAFDEVLCTRQVIQKVVRPKTGLAMVPVLLTPEGEAIQDTTAIMQALEARHPQRSVVPPGTLGVASKLLELYGDEWLLMPAMHYRWHYKRNWPLVFSEFGALVAPRVPRRLAALAGIPLAAYFGGNYGRALGIGKPNRAAIERSYEAFLRDLNAHFEHHDYLLGDRPCEGDFGFMGPLYAHLYRDPAPGALMRRIAPRVAAWVERMNHPTQTHSEETRAFAAEVPRTLDPIFARLFREQWPVVADTLRAVDTWVRTHPDRPTIKRFVGSHAFTIEGATHTRWIQSFTQWMAQHPLDAYAALDADTRETADIWLQRVGGFEAMQTEIPTRVRRQHNRLVVDD